MSNTQKYKVSEPSEDALRAALFDQRIYAHRVLGPEDIGNWKRSCAYYDVVNYINNTSVAIQGIRQGDTYYVSNQMMKLCKIFNWMDRLVYDSHPLGVGRGLLRCTGEDPIDTMESTYSLEGKCHSAFAHWMYMVQEQIFSILERQVKPHCKHINELAQYLSRSLGCHKSFDYGPANELMFIFFLCALFKTDILTAKDTIAAALLLFQRYLELVRRLIVFYRLSSDRIRDETTVDDRNVIPYIWGCAQLCLEPAFEPPQWEEATILELHRKDYMLLSSLEYLQKSMEGDELGVHSYQLWCSLSLSSWPDAYAALMRSYIKYVLYDFYTVQDLIFSEIMSFSRHPAEYMPMACLGQLSTQSSSSSSDESDVATNKGRAEVVKREESTRRVKIEVNVTGLEKQQSKHIQQPQNIPTNILPVNRYSNVNSEVFLGYQKPEQKSDSSSEDNTTLLRRLRTYRKHETRPYQLTESDNDYDKIVVNPQIGKGSTG